MSAIRQDEEVVISLPVDATVIGVITQAVGERFPGATVTISDSLRIRIPADELTRSEAQLEAATTEDVQAGSGAGQEGRRTQRHRVNARRQTDPSGAGGQVAQKGPRVSRYAG